MQNITNIRLIPNEETIKQIARFADNNALPYADFDAHPHCTIIYSRDVIDAKSIRLPAVALPVVGTNAQLKIFKTKDDGDVLVIEFDCSAARVCFDYMKTKYNITTKYDDYKPHITLQKNINVKMAKLPSIPFDLVFDVLLCTNTD